MAKHKSATEVTVVTEERSAIQKWVDRHWGKALLLAIVVAGAILFMQMKSKTEATKKASVWNPILEAEGDVDKLKAAVPNLANPRVQGWAQGMLATQAANDNNPELAIEALQQLSSNSDHILNSSIFAIPNREGGSLAEQAQNALQAQLDWEKANPGLFTNPEPAEGSPVVSIKTAEGDIEIVLYEAEAPKHVENFLKLVDEDFYDGTVFHRVINVPSMKIVQGGDPDSRDADISKWGKGGPGYSVEAEKNDLMHLEGYLSAAMPPGSPDSSGSQFFITLGPAHHLDGRHTIYGKVTKGMDVAQKMLEAPVRDPDQELGTQDIPVNPVAITSVERQ